MIKREDVASLAVAINDISTIKEDVKEIKIKLEQDYVSKEAFDSLREQVTLLRNMMYGVIGIVMVAFIGALIKLVFLQ
jgi:hypothetical protein